MPATTLPPVCLHLYHPGAGPAGGLKVGAVVFLSGCLPTVDIAAGDGEKVAAGTPPKIPRTPEATPPADAG